MLPLQHPQSQNKLLLQTVTWQKDSHQLFDYQCTKNIITQQLTISLQQCFIFFYRYNTKSQIQFIKKLDKIPQKIQGAQLLGCFQIVRGVAKKKFGLRFFQAGEFQYLGKYRERLGTEVSNSSGEYKNQPIYFIVRSLKDAQQQPKGFILKSGNKIKFGRIQFNVAVMKHNVKNIEQPNFFQHEKTIVMDEDLPYNQQLACKICLSNQQNQPTSFFCSPCDCVGSCSIVHFDCLFQWCKTKVKRSKQGRIQHYNFQKFECQICKKYFPRFILRKNTKHDLLPIQKPSCSFLVLSSCPQSSSEYSKTMIVICYSQQSILKVGRNQTCDIRINDISVSRQHASIEMRNGQFLLFDSKSKFGTIVNQPQFYIDLEHVKRGVQIGRTVVMFHQAERLRGSPHSQS